MVRLRRFFDSVEYLMVRVFLLVLLTQELARVVDPNWTQHALAMLQILWTRWTQ